MKLKFYFRLAYLIVIVLLLIIFVCYVIEKSIVDLRKVSVLTKGELNYISKAQIIEVLKPFQHKVWWEFDVSDIKKAFKKYPGIKEIKVQRRWPDHLIVELTEYQSRAYWKSYDEILLEDGDVIVPKYSAGILDLPVFYGSLENIKRIEECYQSMQKITSSYNYNIMDITYQGGQWEIKFDMGVTVWLGEKEAQNKLMQLLQNYKSIEIPQGQKLISVDMRYHNGFAVGFALANELPKKA